jgi:hypothetical protein
MEYNTKMRSRNSNHGFLRGYVASLGTLQNERWIYLKPFSHTPTNFEKYKGRRSIYFIWFITFRILEPLGPCHDHHFPLVSQPYTICMPFLFVSSYIEEGMIHTRSYPKEMTDYDIPSDLQWKEMVQLGKTIHNNGIVWRTLHFLRGSKKSMIET